MPKVAGIGALVLVVVYARMKRYSDSKFLGPLLPCEEGTTYKGLMTLT